MNEINLKEVLATVGLSLKHEAQQAVRLWQITLNIVWASLRSAPTYGTQNHENFQNDSRHSMLVVGFTIGKTNLRNYLQSKNLEVLQNSGY